MSGEVSLAPVARRADWHHAQRRGVSLCPAGHFLERADNTARILDVNFRRQAEQDALQVDGDEQNDSLQRDYYHWASLLRSLSAFENYRKVYRHAITPGAGGGIADFARRHAALAAGLPGRSGAQPQGGGNVAIRRNRTPRGMMHAELRYGRIDDILHTGMHAYLTDFLERINDLGAHQPGFSGGLNARAAMP